MDNLGHTGDKIAWKNQTLEKDEVLTASHEDLILLNVLSLLHPKLPEHVRQIYSDRIGPDKRIMDFHQEILE